MLPWFVGIFFIIGLVIFLYLIRATEDVKEKKEVKSVSIFQGETDAALPKRDDIILAELTEQGQEEDYGILWNAIAGETYNYSISKDGIQIASGTASSNTTVFKVRGLPLEIGSNYEVKVGDTTVSIPFVPPSFDLHSLDVSDNHIDCNTSSTPTNIEVIIDGEQKVPLSAMKIKIEPPGFIVNHPIQGNVVIMIYNGRNTSNILTLTSQGLVLGQTEKGETVLPF